MGQDPVPSVPLRNFSPSLCCSSSGHSQKPSIGSGIIWSKTHTTQPPLPWRHSPLRTSAVLLLSQDSEMLPADLFCTQPSPKHQVTKVSILPSPVNHYLKKTTLSFMKYSPLLLHTRLCFSPAILVLSHSPLPTCSSQVLLVGAAQGSGQAPFSSYTAPCAGVIPPSLLTLNKSADDSYISPESSTTAHLPHQLACLRDSSNLRSTKQNSWFSTSSPPTQPSHSPNFSALVNSSPSSQFLKPEPESSLTSFLPEFP